MKKETLVSRHAETRSADVAIYKKNDDARQGVAASNPVKPLDRYYVAGKTGEKRTARAGDRWAAPNVSFGLIDRPEQVRSGPGRSSFFRRMLESDYNVSGRMMQRPLYSPQEETKFPPKVDSAPAGGSAANYKKKKPGGDVVIQDYRGNLLNESVDLYRRYIEMMKKKIAGLKK
jgi:hypothetical protein